VLPQTKDADFCLYKLFMNSLHHPYAPARTIFLLIICQPKLLTVIANREEQRGGTNVSLARDKGRIVKLT
jgi:hypothetical protein